MERRCNPHHPALSPVYCVVSGMCRMIMIHTYMRSSQVEVLTVDANVTSLAGLVGL